MSSMTGNTTMMIEMLLLLFRLLRVSLLSSRVLSNDFFSSLEGAPSIDLPLSKFSLANSILTSLFLTLILLAGGTKIVVLAEAILEEEKPYPKHVQSEADF